MGVHEEQRLQIVAQLSELLRKSVPVDADLDSIDLGRNEQLGHLAWMLPTIETLTMERRFDKADRWIGFVQGALWAYGMRSINQLRKMNTVAE